MAQQKKKTNSRASRAKQAQKQTTSKPIPSTNISNVEAVNLNQEVLTAIKATPVKAMTISNETSSSVEKANKLRKNRIKYAWAIIGLAATIISIAVINFVTWIIMSNNFTTIEGNTWVVWSQTTLLLIVAGLLSALCLYNALGLTRGNNDSIDVNVTGSLTIVVGSILFCTFMPSIVDLSSREGTLDAAGKPLTENNILQWKDPSGGMIGLFSSLMLIGIAYIAMGSLTLMTKIKTEFHNPDLIEKEIAAEVLNVDIKTINEIDKVIAKEEEKSIHQPKPVKAAPKAPTKAKATTVKKAKK